MKSERNISIKRTSFFRFYEELNDYLNNEQKKKTFSYQFTGQPSIKDIIEAIGVPHIEIDLIIVDGKSVGFDYKMEGGELISVYPVFESFDISNIVHLRSKPLRNNKFIVDINLGKLAKKLRLLGFDTYFNNELDDKEIIKISVGEKKTILTRDKGILKHNSVTHAYWLRSDEPNEQILEVIRRFQLEHEFKPLTRCSSCNGLLHKIEKQKIQDRLFQKTLKNFNEFKECEICTKLYWKGSHYERIEKWIKEISETVRNK